MPASVAVEAMAVWPYAVSLQGSMKRRKEAAMVDAFAVKGGEGEARWWLGALAVIKATAADTGGQLTVVDVTDPPRCRSAAPCSSQGRRGLLGPRG